MARKKLTKMKTHGELVADQQLVDPDFNREWERLAISRAVAARVIAYRGDNKLSQRDLAKLLEMPQPQVTRLESGEYHPSNETLSRLASKLGMEFTISIAPAKSEPKQITKRTREHADAMVEAGDSITRFSVA
ncbi:MAG TPA: helix-turn-helix transcriptional regulator [Thermoleophilaceae bacterium]|jgi:transcriptional regulator with XRE-family HTH domain